MLNYKNIKIFYNIENIYTILLLFIRLLANNSILLYAERIFKAMYRCTRCGAEQPTQAQFCGSCGHSFNTQTHQSPQSNALSYATVDSRQLYPTNQTNTPAYQTLFDAAQTTQTPFPPQPLPPQQPFDFATSFVPFSKEKDEEEEDRDEQGLLFIPPIHSNGTPMVSNTPQISGGPMVHSTPQIADVPPAPSVSPPAQQSIEVQHNLLQVKEPMHVLKPLHHSHAPHAPTHLHTHHPPLTKHKSKSSRLKKPRPLVLVGTSFLLILIVLGTLLAIFFVTPPNLALISGGGSVSYGEALHLHGNWYTPGSTVIFLLDETIPLSARGPDMPAMPYRYAQNSTLAVSSMLSRTNASDKDIVVSVSGTFDATITVDTSWKAGKHTIRALERGGTRSAVTEITVVSETADLANITPASVVLGPITEGDTKVVSTQITLGTMGTHQVTWTASWDQNTAPWLQLDHTSDSIQAPGTQDIMVSANPQKLKAGSYNVTVTFANTSDNKSLSLPISLTVRPNNATTPTFNSVNPNTLVFNTINAGSTQPISQQLTLSTAGKGKVQWQATWDNNASPWLQLDHNGDTIHAPDSQQLTVSIQPQGLVVGQYTAIVTFASKQSTKPLLLTVNVTIQAQAELSGVNPNSIVLGPATEGYAQPLTTQVTLSTSGAGSVQWQASWNQNTNPWLQVDHTSDQIQAPASETIVVGAATGTKAGVYSASILFTNPQSGKTLSLAVNFTVQSAAAPGELSSVTPTTATLGPVTEGYQKTATTQITINTSGTGTVSWNASYDKNQGSWLLLNTTNGQIQAPNSQPITLSAATGMKAGTYSVNVSITNPQSNKTLTFAVTFTVQALPAELSSVAPNPLTLTTATQGYTQPVSAQATLSTTGSGTLNWTATSDANWLSLGNMSGQIQAPSTQTVTIIATTGLQAGNYTGNITFTNAQSGKQLTLAVTFTVQPAPLLSINTNTLNMSTDCQPRRTGWICFVTLTNQSTTDSLTWTSASTNSGTTVVTVIPATNTLAAGQSQRVQISIALQQRGAFSDTVVFTGPGNSQTVTLSYTPIG